MKNILFGILLIYFGSLNAQFSTENIITNNAINASSVFAADLDGDTFIDVLSASQGDNTIAWYKNLDGLGTFGPKQVIAQNLEATRFVNAADLDGDGDIDVLAIAIVTNLVLWYENTDGLGSFGTQ